MITRRDFLAAIGAAGTLAATQACCTNGPRAATGGAGQKTIDRLAALARHSPHVTTADQGAVLSVGNGNFAFNVDCTGLQTLAAEYKVIPLATLSHWGWHEIPSPPGMDLTSLRYKDFPFYGRTMPLATSDTGQKPLYDFLRANPHRLNLGRLALLLDGRPISIGQLSKIDQRLDLATGVITSRFELAGKSVEVVTACHGELDVLGLRIASGLLAEERLSVELAFPYGSTESSGNGADWTKPNAHITNPAPGYLDAALTDFSRTLDNANYQVLLRHQPALVAPAAPHTYHISTPGTDTMELSLHFLSGHNAQHPLSPSVNEIRNSSAGAWSNFWSSGAAIDLGISTDKRAGELERRIVLSQYLTAIHCAGPLPSQETGLLCNSWFGKFHLEMHWWHSVHFTVWNRYAHFARSIGYYATILDSSIARAKRQGFAGARWPKMTSPDGEDSPSPIGPLLIWQQPHPIYYAELAYRNSPTPATLNAWREIVEQTALFMASFAQFVTDRNQYVLGPSIKTVSENEAPETTLNPTYELTAWRFGLSIAQRWRERLNLPRKVEWDNILARLAPPPTKGGVYLMQENQETYSKTWAYEHPALLGAMGVLRGDGIDMATMAANVRKVRETWDFSKVWGWDFPMAALAAARTNQPEAAIDFLTMDAPMNRYLPNGCNFQRDNVPAYFPGNGGLLSAIGMMAGGWTGGPISAHPGFPANGNFFS